jgi:tetratricopeptide (TPR) repeat protein
MRALLLLLLLIAGLRAYTLPDRYRLLEARNAAARGAWAEALSLYDRISVDDDSLRYNRANLLYRLGRWEEAARLYGRILDPALQHARYHNLGNCRALQGRWREAERLYRAALKFAEDPATRANLRLARHKLAKERRNAANEKKKKNAPTDLRPGLRERASDWSREKEREEEALTEAAVKERKHRANVSRGGRALRGQIGRGADGMAGTDTSHPPDSVALRHWRRQLERGKMRSLLLPLEQGENHATPKPW